MKNGFIVKSIRRHLYKPDTIIVEGAFPYDNNENKKLHAYVNGEEADMSINVASGFSIAEKYVHYQSGISEEIIGEFTIPKSGINSIELREESLGKYSRIKKFEGKRLIPVLTTITYSIDYQKRENGNITITGWAAVSKNAVITVMENGKSIAASIERKYRKDVKDLFVEATPNEKFGIEIAIPEAEYHDLKLVIQDNEKIKKIRLDLDSIQTEEDINKSSQNFLLKTIRYYRGNGFVATAGKIVKKILKKENEEDAVEYAKFLEQHEKVDWVHYPLLESSDSYEISKKYLPKGASGVISFGVKGTLEETKKWINSLNLVSLVVHVADTRSHALHPASMTHRQLSEEAQIESGIYPNMIRLSVGIENADDIIKDLEDAFKEI